MNRGRRRTTRLCLLCEKWATRHPSGLCRDCRPIAGPAFVKFSTTIEKENNQ